MANLKLWALTTKSPLAYDSAYLLGRAAGKFSTIHVTAVQSYHSLPQPPANSFDCVLNRTISPDPKFLRGLEDVSNELGARLINSAEPTIRACDKRTYTEDYAEFIPETWRVKNWEDLHSLFQKVNYELVVKYPFGKGGQEVERYNGVADREAVDRLFSICPETDLVAQRFCLGFQSGDKRVILHRSAQGRYKVAAWYKRVPPSGGWISNLGAGGHVEKTELSGEEVRFCQSIAEISGLDYIGLDIGWDQEKCFLIETNAYTGGHMDFDAVYQNLSSGEDFANMVAELCSRD